ncbi:MAG: hypothetical protein ABL997_12525 [Planctomycetota bacterium]
MKTWQVLLPVPCVLALLAMAPQNPQGTQDPAVTDIANVMAVSELQYVDLQGKTSVVPSRNVFEVRMLEDTERGMRIEILYDNGDYSLIDAQALHILRSGKDTMDVRFVRSTRSRMRFPKLQ